MKRKIILLFSCLLLATIVFANDGSFYASGNQLIPINEKQISVKKEILTLRKVGNDFIDVLVYYEFYNTGEEKTITVGFEAQPPVGDVNPVPLNGLHPYMFDFTVQVNNKILPFKVAYVSDSLYVKNGSIKGRSLNEVTQALDTTVESDFFYVYHFQANFKKGINIVQHTYTYQISSSVSDLYFFNYVLTAANRWSNKQIDDFTLIMDMGEFESFNISKTFFKTKDEWLLQGIGKVENYKGNTDMEVLDGITFHVQKGMVFFTKKNFSPKGELAVNCSLEANSLEKKYLPFSYYQQKVIKEPQNDFEKKLLKNWAYARRGYVFQNKELQAFFEKLNWYIPNATYKPIFDQLTDVEKKWMTKWE